MSSKSTWLLAVLAIASVQALPATAREVFFDRVIDVDDFDVDIAYRDSGSSGTNPLFEAKSDLRSAGVLQLGNGVTSTGETSNELFFDVIVDTDDVDPPIDLGIGVTTPSGAAAHITQIGNIAPLPTSFSLSVLLSDPTGSSLPVALKFAGQTAAGLAFDRVGGVALDIQGSTIGLIFNLNISDPQLYNSAAPVFSSLSATASLVPEPATGALLATSLVGLAAARRRFSRHPSATSRRRE
jgi:hypothetical protein